MTKLDRIKEMKKQAVMSRPLYHIGLQSELAQKLEKVWAVYYDALHAAETAALKEEMDNELNK